MLLKNLKEAPIPSDWDKQYFGPDKSFEETVQYAMKKAKELGTGSSRVAFEIKYENRLTALKIAKKASGVWQNETESKIFSDPQMSQLGIFIPMIDYDTKNKKPLWIHVEKAKPVTDLNTILKCMDINPEKYYDYSRSLFDIYDYVWLKTGRTNNSLSFNAIDLKHTFENDIGINPENYLIKGLISFSEKYPNIKLDDLIALENWGIYNGKCVIIDIGLSTEIYKNFYG